MALLFQNMNDYKSYLFLLFFVLCPLVAAKSSDVNNLMLPDELALKIGERIYFSSKQGCASCHGADGVGGVIAGAADIRFPEKWKSYKISRTLNKKIEEDISYKEIVTSLIELGSTKWNKEFYTDEKYNELQDKIFFDEKMLGIHSSDLRFNRNK